MSREFLDKIDKFIEQEEKQMKELYQIAQQFEIVNTELLQEISLVQYMAALGYEPVYETQRGLIAFLQPGFAHRGRARISVNTAIHMHNHLSEVVHAERHITAKHSKYTPFFQSIQDPDEVDEITILFAGTVKIVQKVHACFSKREGLKFHSQQVKFMNRRDRREYKELLNLA